MSESGATHAATSEKSPATSDGPSSWHGQRIAGRYEILGLLGEGGMGTVYRARDIELDELVALKVLRREIVGADGALELFRREVKLARRVTHRNVARMFDIGEHEGERFLTMELIDGEPLSALLARDGALSFPRAAALVRELAGGLAAAHAAGVIHRDLKPDNVLIAADGRVVITDFGIARTHDPGAARTMSVVGTPAYMAPEQVEAGSAVDGRSDLYALGAMLYEMLTGARAWPGDAPFAVAAARLVAPPPDPRKVRPAMPAPVAAVVLRCLARRPDERYATAGEVADAMDAAVASAPTAPLREGQLHHGGFYESAATLAAIHEPQPPGHAARAQKSVAVLPLRSGGQPGDEVLAEGLTEDLIDTLSTTGGLRVCSHGVVARLRGKERDPREIGRELGVQVVVEGSVRRVGDRVRIQARLVGVSDGFQIWARRFERPEGELLAMSDEAAAAIGEALTVDLQAKPRAALAEAGAIGLYLEARHELRKMWEPHVVRAIALFEQALALAPGDPTILAGYATALARQWFFGGGTATGSRERALDVAHRAIAAAPDRGEPHLALATVFFHTGHMEGAVRELDRAIARAPGLAEAHGLLGSILGEIGRSAEAIRSLEIAVALDPCLPTAPSDLARAYELSGRPDLADALFDRYFAGDIESVTLWFACGRLLLWRGDTETAKRRLAQRDDLPGAPSYAKLLFDLAIGGPMPEVPPELLTMRKEHISTRRRMFFLQIEAEISAFGGLSDRALTALESAGQSDLIDLAWLDGCPLLAPLRGEARFAVVRALLAARCERIMAARG